MLKGYVTGLEGKQRTQFWIDDQDHIIIESEDDFWHSRTGGSAVP